MTIPSEPNGSIPRPIVRLEAIARGGVTAPHLAPPYDEAIRGTEAARYTPVEQLGSTDVCGFSPFSDDRSTKHDTAFAKIRARVAGTAPASAILGGG